MVRFVISAALLILIARSGPGQQPGLTPAMPSCPPFSLNARATHPAAHPAARWPNLLFVRFTGPPGLKITVFRGSPKGQTFETPCTLGLRPGYRCRVQITGIPEYPDLVLTPTLEVRGSLKLAHRTQAAEFPVGLFFSAEDFARADAGALVTKVVVLEPPDQAIAEAASADRPLQVNLPPNHDVFLAARDRGRAMLIVYTGPRQATPDEMAATTIPGTLLLPGEQATTVPTVPPTVPYAWVPPHDPLLGPCDPNEEMKLIDGGDRGLPVGFGPERNLAGLDPGDTVAEYVDSKGVRRIACSNRVGFCVPRYLIFRGELYPGENMSLFGPGVTTVAQGRDVVRALTPPLTQHQNIQPFGLASRLRPSSTAQMTGTAVTARVEGLEITATLRPTANVTGACPPPLALEPPDGCLKIDKWPDKCGGLVGDIVTFFIRFTNTGRQPMTGVVVTDNLITRFEYVKGTAKTDREAIFTTQSNDAGSSTLRWELPGVLPPGQSGIVSFQVRIR
jgi:uncharacterized repeat protein (TIGR01451 family)